MSRNDLNGEVTPDLAKLPSQQLALDEVGEPLAHKGLIVRYMDDDTFQRCLEEVVTVHDRLLSKLAE